VLFAVIAAAVVIVVMIGVTYATRAEMLADVELVFSSPLAPVDVRDAGIGRLLSIMAEERYSLCAIEDGYVATFKRRELPRWTYYVAFLLYPIGLLALLRHIWIHARIEVRPSEENGSVIIVSGTLTRRIRDRLKSFFEDAPEIAVSDTAP
jgi:hypothetical protein